MTTPTPNQTPAIRRPVEGIRCLFGRCPGRAQSTSPFCAKHHPPLFSEDFPPLSESNILPLTHRQLSILRGMALGSVLVRNVSRSWRESWVLTNEKCNHTDDPCDCWTIPPFPCHHLEENGLIKAMPKEIKTHDGFERTFRITIRGRQTIWLAEWNGTSATDRATA